MINKIPINYGVLKSLRKDKTQLEVEIESGITRGTLTLMECGRYDPSPEQLEKLARYYKTSTLSLIREDAIPTIKGSAITLANLVGGEVKFKTT